MRKVADILRKAAFLVVLACVAPLASGLSAHAQDLSELRTGKSGDKLLVEADELIYDNDHSTVTARGNTELHYGPRTLQADRVRYDWNTGHVFAEGNVRLPEQIAERLPPEQRAPATSLMLRSIVDHVAYVDGPQLAR